MRTNRGILFVIAVLSFVALPLMACGGGGPGKRIDSVHLARVPKAEKDAMFDAQNRIDVAKENLSEAEKAEKTAEDFYKIVKRELDSAKAKAKLANEAKKIADSGGVAERVTEAGREAEVADLGVSAFEAKMKYAKENRTFSSTNAKLAEAAVYEAEAAFELEKIKLMEANGISVDGVDGVKVRDQHAKYADKLAKIKEKADKSLAKTESHKAEFDNLFAAYEEGLASLRPTSVEPEAPDYLPPAGPSVGPSGTGGTTPTAPPDAAPPPPPPPPDDSGDSGDSSDDSSEGDSGSGDGTR